MGFSNKQRRLDNARAYRVFKEKPFKDAVVVSTTDINVPLTRKEKYHNFLDSSHWKQLRKTRISRNQKCEGCGSRGILHVHHFNYENQYSSKKSKAIKHTKVLCASCHKAFHDRYGVKKDMTLEMNEFMTEVKRDMANAKKLWIEIYENESWLGKL